MKFKVAAFLLFNLVVVNCSFGQNFTIYGDKVFGGDLGESNAMITKVNNNLMVIGTTYSNYGTGNVTDTVCNNVTLSQNSDAWLVMIDTALNILWDKSIGGERGEIINSSVVNPVENKYFFVTYSNSDISCEKSENNKSYPNTSYDYWIYCVDSLGNKLFDKTFGSDVVDDFPYLTMLSDSNFLVVGRNIGGPGGDKTVNGYGAEDYWAVKFDQSGNKIWDNVYGGSGIEWGYDNSFGINVVPTENGSFVLAGSTDSDISGNISQPNQGVTDMWMIKVDNAGNKIWDKRFGGTSADNLSCMIKSGDGYMLMGTTESSQGGDVSDPTIGGFDVWVLKLDSVGNKIWDKRYGGSANEYANTMVATVDGGYLISATTESPADFDVTENSYGAMDYWIFKIDSVGNKSVDKRFGGPGNDRVSNFIIMPDSSIFLCGYADSGTSPVKTEFGYGFSDYWVIHFKNESLYSGVGDELEESVVSVYPNPTADWINIDVKQNKGNNTFILFDILGHQLFTEKIEANYKFNLKNYEGSIYFYQVTNEEGHSQFGKIVKQ